MKNISKISADRSEKNENGPIRGLCGRRGQVSPKKRMAEKHLPFSDKLKVIVGRNVETHDKSCVFFSAACEARNREGDEVISAQIYVPQCSLSNIRNFGDI